MEGLFGTEGKSVRGGGLSACLPLHHTDFRHVVMYWFLPSSPRTVQFLLPKAPDNVVSTASLNLARRPLSASEGATAVIMSSLSGVIRGGMVDEIGDVKRV